MIKDPVKRASATESLRAMTTERGEFSEHCKKLAYANRMKSRWRVDNILDLIDVLEKYTDDCYKKGKPLTMSGYIMASGMSKTSFYEMLNGKFDDAVIEYKIVRNLPMDAEFDGDIPLIPFSEVLEKCSLLVEQQLEENCYMNKGNPAGSIFALKCKHKWIEDQAPQTLNQTLVIADAEQAKKALELLK